MKNKQIIQAMILLMSMIVLLTLPAYALTEPSSIEEKLKQLTTELEAKRIEFHIPGMAIAVVKDDKIILSKGFGVMDMEQQTPVTPETLFSIGSSSKAFTATLVGMFVDQEKLDWDDQVINHLPNYQFKVDDEVLPITYRDMLSHRTGYTRNDLLWASGKASRETILNTATQAEPVDDFRKNFFYNNVMFLAAGEAMAKVSGKSWDHLLNDMIINPLGMKNTTSLHEAAVANRQISMGYQWNDATEEHDLMPRRNLNNVAPAGGIYSNVNDMAQWVRFQLNQGQVKSEQGNKQLISQQVLLETHEPQIDIASEVDYGMGWMLRQWQNQKVIEHGGNIDGYGAQVALLPESNLGFVLLTNVTATPLQQLSMNIVWDHLAETKETANQTTEAKIDYQKYTGDYHANFGPFRDTFFTFLVKEDGKPAVDVPGQMVYELVDPDDTGKWFFKLTNTISVSFDYDSNGAIAAMRMQQNGLNFELPRKDFDILPETEVSNFNEFLGLYESKKLKGNIKAMIQNHRLTMDVPNQMAYELHLPDDNGFRQFRIKGDTSVKFIRDDSGVVTAVELYKNQNELVETAHKIPDTTAEALPTVEDIMQLRKTKKRIKALKKKSGFMITGEIKVLSSGITGQVTTQFDHEHNYRKFMDFGVFGAITTVVNENRGSTYGINPYTELTGKYLKQVQRESPLSSVDWHSHYDHIKVIGTTEVNDQKVYELTLKEQDLPAVTAYIDTITGDVMKIKAQILIPSIGSVGIEVIHADYREKHGLRIPFKTTIKNPMMGEMVLNYNTFKAKQKFAPDLFNTSKPAIKN
ncbi:MAG: serine hydrolase domain-containing protein [Marinicella sp.]